MRLRCYISVTDISVNDIRSRLAPSEATPGRLVRFSSTRMAASEGESLIDLPDIRVRDASVPDNSNPTISVTDRLPPALKAVIAISPVFKCLAYIDANKIWHHNSDGKEIEGVFAWREHP